MGEMLHAALSPDHHSHTFVLSQSPGSCTTVPFMSSAPADPRRVHAASVCLLSTWHGTLVLRRPSMMQHKSRGGTLQKWQERQCTRLARCDAQDSHRGGECRELGEDASELRLLLCRERHADGRKSTNVVTACGIFVHDILEAAPIDKYFEMFKPGSGAEGGFIRLRMALVSEEEVQQREQGASCFALNRRCVYLVLCGACVNLPLLASPPPWRIFAW